MKELKANDGSGWVDGSGGKWTLYVDVVCDDVDDVCVVSGVGGDGNVFGKPKEDISLDEIDVTSHVTSFSSNEMSSCRFPENIFTMDCKIVVHHFVLSYFLP